MKLEPFLSKVAQLSGCGVKKKTKTKRSLVWGTLIMVSRILNSVWRHCIMLTLSLCPAEEEADWLHSLVSNTLAVMAIMGIKNVCSREV